MNSSGACGRALQAWRFTSTLRFLFINLRRPLGCCRTSRGPRDGLK